MVFRGTGEPEDVVFFGEDGGEGMGAEGGGTRD